MEQQLSAEAAAHVHKFKWMLPLQLQLQEIVRILGSKRGMDCLDVGVDNGAVSRLLRRQGGSWQSAVRDRAQEAAVRELVGDTVHVVQGDALPFESKSFDVVVVMDLLERVEDDSRFIEECHRVLKTNGMLIVAVAAIKPFSLINPLRRLLGLSPECQGRVRAGYTESHLFAILKHGFDVHQVRTCSRFFVQCVDAFVRRGAGGTRVVTGLLYRLAFQFDALIFFTRGHTLVAASKRRAWLPRKTPVLVDGRSISEAVLSRPLD